MGTRLAAAIAAEKLDEFGNPTQPYRQHPIQTHNSHATAKCKRLTTDDTSTDVEDDDFAASSTDDESDEQSKSNLFVYFHDNYTHAAISTPPSIASPSAQTSSIMGSPQKSFTT